MVVDAGGFKSKYISLIEVNDRAFYQQKIENGNLKFVSLKTV